MQIFVYCLIFFLIIAGFTLAYILLRKREKRILDDSHQSQNLTQGIVTKHTKLKKNKAVERVVEQKKVVQEEISADTLEDFSLTEEDIQQTKKSLPEFMKKGSTLSSNLNIDEKEPKYKKSAFDDEENEDEDDDFDDIESAYQDFIRRKKNDVFNTNRLNKSSNYDMSSFKRDYKSGKVDIAEMIKKMSPEMKNLLLTNLLSRKDFDVEDL